MFATGVPARTDRRAAVHRPWRVRPDRVVHDRPAEVLAVLQHARAVVEAGWVQNRWTARPAPQPAVETRPVTTGGAAEPVAGACVVAAVALAVRARDPRADLTEATGPAIAALWDAVHDDARFRAAGRSAPHGVRVARMRELVRWNDDPGRTRADVVAALNRAAARVVARTVDPAHA